MSSSWAKEHHNIVGIHSVMYFSCRAITHVYLIFKIVLYSSPNLEFADTYPFIKKSYVPASFRIDYEYYSHFNRSLRE